METFTININQTDKLFFTSDLHINHFNIAKICNRPYTTCSEMNESLIENWNKVVPPDGLVINCGDLMLLKEENMKEYNNICNKLHGTQILVRGNHDKIPVFEAKVFETNHLVMTCDILELKIADDEGLPLSTIIACHYPMLTFPHKIYKDVFQIYGHVHTLKDGTISGYDKDIIPALRYNQYDVGVDQNNYTPVSYIQLMSIFKERHVTNIQ